MNSFKLFGKYPIRCLHYPILVLTSIYKISAEDFEKIKKYAILIYKTYPKIPRDVKEDLEFLGPEIIMETVYIFKFRSLTDYRRFCKIHLNKDKCIVIHNLKEIEIYNIEKVFLESNSVIKVTLESGTTYRTTLQVVYIMLEELYNKKKINITDFDNILHQKNILPKEKSILDKRQQSSYITYWYLPYRLLKDFSRENGFIIDKPYKNKSEIILKIYTNETIEELKDKFYRWILNKMNSNKNMEVRP